MSPGRARHSFRERSSYGTSGDLLEQNQQEVKAEAGRSGLSKGDRGAIVD